MKSVGNNIVFILLLFSFINCFSQNRKELEDKKKNTLQEIAYTSKLIDEIRNNKKNNINQLHLINKRITLKNSLINDINNEINYLDQLISEKEIINSIITEDIEKIKREYAKIIFETYKHSKSNNVVLYLLSSHNISQVYKRIQYLKQYSDYRKKQTVILYSLNTLIETEKIKLQAIKQDKNLLVEEKNSEKMKLESEKIEQNQLISTLKKKEKKLIEELNEKKRIAKDLELAIQRVIEEEIKKSKTKDKFNELTPEERLISDNFIKNKGKLPWPTKRGIVTSDFGKHEHPVLKGIFVNNNGIDITTVKGENVRAIFGGVVTRILAIKGANYTVIIRHGNYLTVYQNLVNVTVKKGDTVETKQVIGDVFYNEEDNASILHIEIWNEINKLNPIEWLAQKN